MDSLVDKIRQWFLGFLGVNQVCTKGNEDFYRTIAHKLMYVPRVFGDESRLSIGRSVVLNDALINTSSGCVVINDFVFFGHNVFILTGRHDYVKKNIDRQTAVPATGCDIVIGQGVWIASNVTVLGPCVIGDNAVIAAGAVVIGNVPSNSVYAGVPACSIEVEGSIGSD